MLSRVLKAVPWSQLVITSNFMTMGQLVMMILVLWQMADILDEIAKRGGFTWRNPFPVTKGPGENHTWSGCMGHQRVGYKCGQLVDPLCRKTQDGHRFPSRLCGSTSYIIIAIKEEDTNGSSNETADFWSWLKPLNYHCYFCFWCPVQHS
jgi:hypothetical protein